MPRPVDSANRRLVVFHCLQPQSTALYEVVEERTWTLCGTPECSVKFASHSWNFVSVLNLCEEVLGTRDYSVQRTWKGRGCTAPCCFFSFVPLLCTVRLAQGVDWWALGVLLFEMMAGLGKPKAESHTLLTDCWVMHCLS